MEDNGGSNPRLNMKHGFIHHIRRNQMKRDEYDKEMRARKSRPRKEEKTQYPDKEVYRARRISPNNQDPSCEERKSGPGKLLYVLEYCDNDGWIHKVLVCKGDNPSALAKRLVRDANIPAELLETLEWKIEQDIVKRNDTK